MDIAERSRRIESYGRAADLLEAALAEFPRAMWDYRSPDDPWTVRAIIIHLADSEANSYVRCRRCIAEPGSTVMAYDENRWVEALQYGDQDPDAAVALFRHLRAATYRLIHGLTGPVWDQTIEHPENGTMTLEDWLVVYEDHVPAHIRQMRAIFERWRTSSAAG